MLTHADHLATARERTAAIVNAHQQVAWLVAARGLLCPSLDLTEWPGRRVLCLNDGVERMLVQVRISLWSLPTELLRWADALGADRVQCRRRDVDTCLWLNHRDEVFGLAWQIGSALNRRGTGERLPAIDPPWHRNNRGRLTDDGSMSVTALRTTMTALGRYPMESS